MDLLSKGLPGLPGLPTGLPTGLPGLPTGLPTGLSDAATGTPPPNTDAGPPPNTDAGPPPPPNTDAGTPPPATGPPLPTGLPDAGAMLDLAEKLPLPPNVKMALELAKGIGDMFKPEKKVPAPDMKELEKASSAEVLTDFILKQQFDQRLYHKYEKPKDEDENVTDNNDEYKVDINKFNCKQIGGGDEKEPFPEYVDTNLKQIIQDKIQCKYIKEFIVKNFEEFIEKKVLHTHYHSKDGKSNNIDSLSIFYRHGLSKIISKMMDDLKHNGDIMDFFLDQLVEIVMDMEDKKMINFLDSMDNSFLFDVMTGEKIIGYNAGNENHETRMKQILLKLYPESEFNALMLEIEKKENTMSSSEIQQWKKIYNDTITEEKKLEEEKQAKEKLLLEKIGLDKVLKLFNINKNPRKINKINTTYINKKTNFEGGRTTRKQKN